MKFDAISVSWILLGRTGDSPLAQWGGGYGGWGMGPGMMGDWGATGWLHFILMIVFWVLVIAGLVFLLRWLIQATRGEKGGSRALEILRERYARGEITHEEFQRLKRELQAP